VVNTQLLTSPTKSSYEWSSFI